MFASPWKDALIVLFVVLLFFGPKRLPALSRSIGESIKEFRGGIAHISDDKSELPSSSTDASTTSSEQHTSSTSSEHTNA